MIVCLIRHGQTDWNVKRFFQGVRDIPLNDTGRQQAREAAEELRAEGTHFSRVYCSPLTRAIETATLISGFSKEEMVIDERLREMGFGEFEGTPFDARPPLIKTFFEDPEHFVPEKGMESYDSLFERTASFLADIKSQASPGDENILVQTHGCCMLALLAHLDAVPLTAFWERKVNNCQCVRYRIDAPHAEFVRIP